MSETLTKEEAIAKALEAAKEKENEFLSKNKTLRELLATRTEGEISLPKANLNGISILVEELGNLVEMDLTNLANLRTIVWALLNQDNDDIVNWSDAQRKKAIFQVGKELDLENLTPMMEAVIQALDMRAADPANPTKSSPKKKK
jgi:hypothetical protein